MIDQIFETLKYGFFNEWPYDLNIVIITLKLINVLVVIIF